MSIQRRVTRNYMKKEGLDLSRVFTGGNPRQTNNRKPTKRTGKVRNSCHFPESIK